MEIALYCNWGQAETAILIPHDYSPHLAFQTALMDTSIFGIVETLRAKNDKENILAQRVTYIGKICNREELFKNGETPDTWLAENVKAVEDIGTSITIRSRRGKIVCFRLTENTDVYDPTTERMVIIGGKPVDQPVQDKNPDPPYLYFKRPNIKSHLRP